MILSYSSYNGGFLGSKNGFRASKLRKGRSVVLPFFLQAVQLNEGNVRPKKVSGKPLK